MTQAAFFVLVALTDGPRHGYGIVQEAEALSEGHVELRIGTLYGLLDRLTQEELVEPDREEVHRGRLRRYYRLTDKGEAALAVEADRMAEDARTATHRMAKRRDRASRPRPGLAGGEA